MSIKKNNNLLNWHIFNKKKIYKLKSYTQLGVLMQDDILVMNDCVEAVYLYYNAI